MRRPTTFLLCAVLLAGTVMGAPDDEPEARKTALSLAGAFSNDGFKIRDGNWTGPIHPKDNLLIQVHLYAGNQYWFCAGASRRAKQLSVSVFDETGALMQTQPYQSEILKDALPAGDAAKGNSSTKSDSDEGPKAAAGFAPAVSGPYYVRIQETDGEAATFCFIYSYK